MTKEVSDKLQELKIPELKSSLTSKLKNEVYKAISEIKTTFQDSPEGMKYFLNRYEDLIDDQNKDYKNKKIIATNCIYVPEELIYASGAIPVRICNGFYALDQAGANYLPAKACPLVRSTIGMIDNNYYPFGAEPLMVVNPSSCDQKKKMGEIQTKSNIPIYLLETPPVKDSDDAREYWLKSIIRFKSILEKTSRQKITKSKLKSAINKIYLAQNEFRRFNNLRKNAGIITGTEAITVINTYFFDDIESWTTHLNLLNNELEKKIQIKKQLNSTDKPRIILTGSPSIFPNIKIPLLIEKHGGIVVNDDFCSSTRFLYDTIAVDEWNMYDMIPAIAERYLKPSTCPNLSPNKDRGRKLIETIKEFNANGVVYQSLAGCHLFEIESLNIISLLRQSGIPVLYIEVDYSPENTGQIITRLEAFLESLT